MKSEHQLASLIVIFVVLLSGCGKPVDRVPDSVGVDNLDKVREAAIALRVAINDKGTSYDEFRPLIEKFAVEIAIAKEKGEKSEALRRYDFALAEIQHNYGNGAMLRFWVVPVKAMWTLEDAMLIQRGQPPKWYEKLPPKDW
jgi:hypothetical protein